MSFDRLTPLENKSRDTLLYLRDYLVLGKKAGQRDFQNIVGMVRDTIVALENKMFGCPTGAHASTCDCTPEKKGICRSAGNHTPRKKGTL